MEGNVMSTSVLEVSLLGVGAVLRVERHAWSMVKRLRQATNDYAPLSPSIPCHSRTNGLARLLLPAYCHILFDVLRLQVMTSVVKGRWTVRKAVDEGSSQVMCGD